MNKVATFLCLGTLVCFLIPLQAVQNGGDPILNAFNSLLNESDAQAEDTISAVYQVDSIQKIFEQFDANEKSIEDILDAIDLEATTIGVLDKEQAELHKNSLLHTLFICLYNRKECNDKEFIKDFLRNYQNRWGRDEKLHTAFCRTLGGSFYVSFCSIEKIESDITAAKKSLSAEESLEQKRKLQSDKLLFMFVKVCIPHFLKNIEEVPSESSSYQLKHTTGCNSFCIQMMERVNALIDIHSDRPSVSSSTDSLLASVGIVSGLAAASFALAPTSLIDSATSEVQFPHKRRKISILNFIQKNPKRAAVIAGGFAVMCGVGVWWRNS